MKQFSDSRRFAYFETVFIQLLFWLFILCITIQCIYGVFFLSAGSKLISYSTGSQKKEPISVIVCAKNEASNLKLCLPSILTQRYMNDVGNPLFEVIVVDDASVDDTKNVLGSLQNTYTNLRVVSANADQAHSTHGKKYALAKGVSEAKYEHLVFTDADCLPASEDWLALMSAPLSVGKEIVIGYGKYKQSKGLLNAFIRWETVHTFLQYNAYTLIGKPYMAVGRNLACTKNIWLRAHETKIWDTLPYGDDDLLIQTVANATNTIIVSDPCSFTITEAKKTWKGWIRQKQRHMSTGKYYRTGIKALLSIYASSHAAMWILFFVLLFNLNSIFIGDIMVVRCIIYAIAFANTANKLKEKKIAVYFLLFDFCWMLYNFTFSPYIILKNKKQWI